MMTKPDAIRKTRNLMATVAVGLGASSISAAFAVSWWATWFDAWLAIVSLATGVGFILALIFAIVSEIDRLDAMRNN